MARGPKIVVVPGMTKAQIAAARAQRQASLFGRVGMALDSRGHQKEQRRREREVERHWDILEGHKPTKRPLSKTQKALLLGVSGIGGLVIANKMDGLVYHPMGRPVPASLVPAIISGIGYLALRKRHPNIAQAAATAGIGILIGAFIKAIQRASGGKT